MDSLIKETETGFSPFIVSSVNLTDSLLAMITAVIISFILSSIYIKTHSGYSYSRNFLFSLILISLTIALIMTIIGSNIARAFALVGAMSIVRFRNPIKDTRDLSYIFMSIAVGMACGTGFYIYAVFFIILVTIIELVFKLSDFGKINSKNYVVSYELNINNFDELISFCENNFKEFNIISKENISNDNSKLLLIANLKTHKSNEINILLDKLNKNDTVQKFEILTGYENIES